MLLIHYKYNVIRVVSKEMQLFFFTVKRYICATYTQTVAPVYPYTYTYTYYC